MPAPSTKTYRVVSVLLFATSMGVGACASEPIFDPSAGTENQGVVNANVVVAEAQVADDILVRDDALYLPLAVYAGLQDTLPIGAMYVGAPATSVDRKSKNPFGYARRVKGMKAEGRILKIETEPVGLTDLFDSLTLAQRVDPTPSSTDVRAGNVGLRDEADPDRLTAKNSVGFESVPFGLASQDLSIDDGATSASVNFSFVNAHARWQPTFQVQVGKADGPDGVTSYAYTDLGLRYEAGFDYCGEIEVNGGATPKIGKTGELSRVLFDERIASTPTVVIAGVPVVFTVRLQSTIGCSWNVGAKAQVAGTVRVFGHPTVRIGQAPTSGGPTNTPDEAIQVRATLDSSLEGSLGMSCEIVGKLGLYLWDTVGFYGAIKPTADATITGRLAEATGQAAASVCLDVSASVPTELGIEARAFGQTLFANSIATPDLVGALAAPQVCLGADSCRGKSGWYCSDFSDTHAYQCGEGATALGHDCASGTYCESASDGTAVLDATGAPTCGSTKPTREEAPAIQCPAAVSTEVESYAETGPCAEGGFAHVSFCSSSEPHKLFECVSGFQRESLCANDHYCVPPGSSYENIDRNPMEAQQCGETPYVCPSVYDAGWYCSTLSPNTAIQCLGSYQEEPVMPGKAKPCGAGYLCQRDPNGQNDAALIDASGNPVCVKAPSP